MPWPNSAREEGYVVQPEDWNAVAGALSAWGGDVDANGGTLSNVSVVGQLQLVSTTEPTASEANRGKVILVAGGAGVPDSLRVCVKDGADSYAWVALY
jgi:hypothetical protein